MKIYSKRSAVGGFSDDYYWSSTGSSAENAWLQDFNDGDQYHDNKYGRWCVRAFIY